MLLVVEPSGYAATARLLGDTVAECVRLAWVGLHVELDGSSGMAGSDDVGTEWGASYDAAAEQATQATEDIGNACYQLATLLEQTGINYDSADQASVPGGAMRHEVARWKRSATTLGSLPSAMGAGVPAPGGWSLLQHAVGKLWPDGHQDRLRTAAGLWQRAGDQLDALVPDIERAATDLMLQRAPEVDDAFTVIDAMAGHVAELADSYRRIGAACAGYAHHLDAAHHAIISEIKSFAEWTVGIESVGGLFSICSLGLSEVGAQISEAAEVLRAAKAIKAAIETLEALALEERAVVEAAAVRVAALSDKVEPILARRLEEAQLDEVSARGALVEGQKAVAQTEGVVVGGSPEAVSLGRLDEAADDVVASKPVVDSPKLQHIVNDLYKGAERPGHVGNGTTADAIRYERATGKSTSGKMHSTKGREYARSLRKLLRAPSLSLRDQRIAQELLEDLESALRGE